MSKYYLDANGVRILVNAINNQLDNKVDRSELNSYATKDDLSNVSVDLNGYATENYVNNVVNNLDIPDEYDDTEIREAIEELNQKTGGVYHYKGSVADLAALQAIESPEIGDTYNLADTGMNAAWNGTEWDEFGSVVDLSEYLKEEQVIAITRSELNSILFSGKTAVVSDKESMVAMISNEQSEVEITLNSNLDLDAPIVVPAGKKVTLNLADNEIESTGAQAIVANGVGSEVTIVGGSISSNANCTVQAQNGGKVIIDGTDIVSTNNNCVGSRGAGSEVVINSGSVTGQEYGVIVIDGGDATINGGTIKGLDNFAVGGNGTPGRGDCDVTINGGVLEGHITSAGYIATAIYWPNTGTLTINGGTIVSDGAGIVMRGGTVNLNSGTVITANGATGVTGRAGDARQVVGPYAVVYDKNSKYPAYETLELNIASDVVLQGTDGDIQIIMPDGETADMANINDNR